MKINDLVEHWDFGTGTVIKLSEPSPLFAYQIATVYFITGRTEELVTTSLLPITSKILDKS